MQNINIITGFGYLTEIATSHIIAKTAYPIGSIPLDDGYTYTEVADQEELDAIVVYVPPIPPLQAFDWSIFATGLQVAFQPIADYTDVLVFYPMVIDYARVKNFTGMNGFLQGLITAGMLSQDHFDMLNSVAEQQGIDITNPPIGG